MTDLDTTQALNQAIKAVKSQEWQKARILLANVIKGDPDNAQAWLWLSAALSDPYDQERCLLRVLEIQPGSPLAEQGLTVARQKITAMLFERAQQALRYDQRVARDTLLELVERDETRIEAWEMLRTVMETSEEQEICLQNILTLDPDNADAQEALALLQEAQQESVIDPTQTIESEAITDEERVAPTLAGEILGEDYRGKHTTVIPEPEPEKMPLSEIRWKEKFSDVLNCPYCLAHTTFEDKRCPTCGNPLWERRLVNPKRSTKLVLVTLFQVFNTGIACVAPLLAIMAVAVMLQVPSSSALLGAYFGNPSELNEEIVTAAHAMLPPILVYLGWLPALFSGALTLAIHLRWRPVFYFLLANAILGLISSLISLGQFSLQEYPVLFVGGLISLGLSVGFAIFIISMEEDFAYRRVRYQLEVDLDLNDGIACLKQGNAYAQRSMWGKAAVHYRKATALAPKITNGYRALAEACIHLREWAIAKAALESAQTLAPNDERITQRLAQVEKKLNTAA